MLGLGSLSTCFFALSSSSSSSSAGTNYSFRAEKLKGALELFHEAQELVTEEKYQEACDVYMQGIFMGRKSVQALVEQQQQNGNNAKKETKENDNDNDDPQEALDWLISSYLGCSQARIQMKDWNKARADAWAACSYSQNRNLQALQCMLTICENTNDRMGELQTLKSMLPLLVQVLADDENENDLQTTTMYQQQQQQQTIQERVAKLEEELERKYRQE